jgi:colanic acid/amylovoran biosynthesis glycosyltransferase
VIIMRVAFLVHKFPQTSEVFIINQVADLLDRGVDVTIFRMEKGDPSTVSDRYRSHHMESKARTFGPPSSKIAQIFGVLPPLFSLLTSPALLLRCRSLRDIYAVAAFKNESFDIVHCHFGRMAVRYLPLRRLLGHTMPVLTSFYGNDVSHLPQLKGASYYDELKRECHSYIVMSNNMKERVVALGFSADEISVLPVSIDVDSFPFVERTITGDEPVEMISVGRFTEKKGFDDLLHAIALVKEKATRPFNVTVIGGGELESQLKGLADDLKINDVVSFPGYMKAEELFQLFLKKHLYLQPSKTAKNGDME